MLLVLSDVILSSKEQALKGMKAVIKRNKLTETINIVANLLIYLPHRINFLGTGQHQCNIQTMIKHYTRSDTGIKLNLLRQDYLKS